METHFPAFEAHRAAPWHRLVPRRRLVIGVLIWVTAVTAPILLSSCADEFSGPPPPSQTQELCTRWGYAPNDPVCLNTFRRDPPNR